MRAFLLCLLASVAAGAILRKNAAQTYTRTLTFPTTLSGNDFRVKSAWTGAKGGGNVLVVDLSTTIVPRFVLRFFAGANGVLQSHAARWSLLKLVEYTEVNGQPGFQADYDNITANYSLIDPLLPQNRRWGSWAKTTDAVTGIHSICASLNPVNGNTAFLFKICANVCPKLTTQNRTGPGTGCGKPNRSCKPGGIHWTARIENFPWTNGTAGVALKMAFDTRNAVREIVRNGTTTDEATPDPREPILTTTAEEDDNDSVNDLGDSNTAAWERTIDQSGGTCANCSTAEVVREIYKAGEWSRDVDNIQATFNNFSVTENLDVNRTFRVTYISMVTSCQPTVLQWDPDLTNSDANAALGVVPSLAVLVWLLAFFH